MPEAPPAPAWVEAVQLHYSKGAAVLLLCDFDGTLAPIVAHPSLVQLPDHTRQVLLQFHTTPRFGVGFISGRAIHDLQQQVQLTGCYYAGSGGQVLDLQGQVEQAPYLATTNNELAVIQEQLAPVLAHYPGTWCETKPGALSLHHRVLSEAEEIPFLRDVHAILMQHPTYTSRGVSRALEVAHAQAWNKGTAVARICSHFQGTTQPALLPIYCGDAPNDAEGMAAVLERGGITLGVGPDAPAEAQHTVNTPEELAMQFRQLATRLL